MTTWPLHIAITGAAGQAGLGIRPLLRERGHRLTLLDAAPIAPLSGERALVADITDLDAVRAAVRDADLVVHLAGYSKENTWEEIVRVNLGGTRTVLEAVRRESVERIVVASSMHVVGYWPVPEHEVDDLAVRPDTYYGVSKAAIEAMTSLYADRFGLTAVIARIGTLQERPTSARALSTWLSFDDFVRLIEAAGTTSERGTHLVWATSANSRRWFSLEPGRRLGYAPIDDAEEHIDPERRHVAEHGNGRIGAAFTERELGAVWQVDDCARGEATR